MELKIRHKEIKKRKLITKRYNTKEKNLLYHLGFGRAITERHTQRQTRINKNYDVGLIHAETKI